MVLLLGLLPLQRSLLVVICRDWLLIRLRLLLGWRQVLLELVRLILRYCWWWDVGGWRLWRGQMRGFEGWLGRE